MSNSKLLERLKLRRFCSQYEYLETELDETRYLFEKYNKQFLEENYKTEPTENSQSANGPISMDIHIYKELPKEVPEELPEELPKELPEELPEDFDELQGESSQDLDINIKRLYRRLSLKTHPDKPGGDKESFEEVNDAFKNKDFLKLLLLASKYSIDIDDITIPMDNFEKNILDLKEKINNFKRTLAWNWATATPDQKEIFKRKFNL